MAEPALPADVRRLCAAVRAGDTTALWVLGDRLAEAADAALCRGVLAEVTPAGARPPLDHRMPVADFAHFVRMGSRLQTLLLFNLRVAVDNWAAGGTLPPSVSPDVDALTVGDLLRLGSRRLRAVRDFGPKSLKELTDILSRVGYTLPRESGKWQPVTQGTLF
jgi:hypothetical protein